MRHDNDNETLLQQAQRHRADGSFWAWIVTLPVDTQWALYHAARSHSRVRR